MLLSSEETLLIKFMSLIKKFNISTILFRINILLFSEELDQMYYTLEDYKHELYNELTSNDFDESLLNEYESRLNVLTSIVNMVKAYLN